MFDPTTWDFPLFIAVPLLFMIVFLRSSATYWLGRGVAAGVRRTSAVKLLESTKYSTGARWLNRWGAVAVALCFLTVGVQTMVLLAAGVTKMPLRRYLPAAIVGCIMWAFLYGTVGMIGFHAIALLWGQSPWLVLALGVMLAALIVWLVRRRHQPVLAEPQT